MLMLIYSMKKHTVMKNTGALVIGLMKLVARFEFLTVMLWKSQVVWEVMLCHFEGL